MNCVATVRAAFFMRSFGYAFFVEGIIKMKRMLLSISCIVLLFGIVPINAFAATKYTEGDYTYKVYSGEAYITDFNDAVSGVL